MEYIAGEYRLQSILFPELLDNYVSEQKAVSSPEGEGGAVAVRGVKA
jgi:hypothetical protein